MMKTLPHGNPIFNESGTDKILETLIRYSGLKKT